MTFISSPIASATPKPRGRLFNLGQAIAVWRQRQHLRRLDDRALRDIGLRRSDAEMEAARPIWDVPHHWQR